MVSTIDVRKENKAIKKLKREFRQRFSKENQLNANFYTDIPTENFHKWHFEVDGMYVEMIYDFKYNLVTIAKKPINQLTYFVFEAELTETDGTPTNEMIKFCCSNVRWATLKKELKDWLIVRSSVKRIYETRDRNEARAIATEY